MASNKILLELREDCECERCSYCPLEALVKSFDDRLLEQHKCVEKFKMEKQLITWDEAYTIWSEMGFAKKFAKVYQEGISFRELYPKIMKS